jgi:hypothetical protein
MTNTSDSNLLWTGEHWILYLRKPGEDVNTGSVSLYKTSFSPAGEGTVALVGAEGEAGISPTMCTDNRSLAAFVSETVIKWSVSPFPEGLPVVDARITRGGDVTASPEWRVETADDLVVARWTEIGPAAIMDRPLESPGKAVTSSVLFFTDTAEMTVNGAAVDGVPFVREDWRNAIGRAGTSCCFALSETVVSRD